MPWLLLAALLVPFLYPLLSVLEYALRRERAFIRRG